MADVEMKPEEGLQKRGRGFNEDAGDAMEYDTVQMDSSTSGNAARSVEGWIIIVTNVHEEASEEDLMDLFSDFGKVQNMHLNLDRRTGYVKGYALIEYATKKEADAAVQGANDTEFLEQTIHVYVHELTVSNTRA
ncbi:hypothetical protein QFC20_001043 [Naganishia adeliensis]|uniref:Uncharacterized protein n=1 Tax=Naganishia adeliensis TaxID=92952 RepID=A0ACC2WWE0_9TREE|nr:hypothetical protein QFC20_001043 [Naganishia adeliensis]